MALQTKTLSALTAEIKTEARVDGSTNLDVFIHALINELLLGYVEVTRYQELLVRDEAIVTVNAQGLYDLPEDFQSILSVRYRHASQTAYHHLNHRPQFVKEADGRYPNYYDLSGGQLLVYPYSGLLATDVLLINYYKYPDELASADDVFPIPKLLVPIKRQAIARTHLYNRDLQVASVFRGESADNETKSRRSESPNRG